MNPISDIFIVIYILSIVWFGLVGILMYLIKKTQLTHVDEFRRRLVFAILFLSACMGTSIISFNISLSQEVLNVVFSLAFLGLISFFLLTLLGIYKLIDYISSIIEIKTKNFRIYALLISIMISIGFHFANTIIRGAAINLLLAYIYDILNIFLFYATIHIFLLYKEVREIKINIVLFIGLSFSCILPISIFGPFIDVYDPSFLLLLLSLFTGVNIFLIIGYLDFKKRVKNL